MTGLLFPKPIKKKKKKAHKPSILQEKSERRCLLCIALNNDYSLKSCLEEHHIIFGSGKREISEAEGLKAYLCLNHHRVGKEAVHNNCENAELLKRLAQEQFETKHSHKEWMDLVHKNYL